MFFEQLKQSADLVLIDSPPVLAVSDALAIAQLADATIVIAQAKKTKRRELERTLEALDRVDATIVGAVLNRANRAGRGVYSHGYVPDAPKRGRRGINADRRPLTANGHLHPREETKPAIEGSVAPGQRHQS